MAKTYDHTRLAYHRSTQTIHDKVPPYLVVAMWTRGAWYIQVPSSVIGDTDWDVADPVAVKVFDRIKGSSFVNGRS